MEEFSDKATAMRKLSSAGKNDDSFYLPPEVLDNPDFKRDLFLSPDGKAVRISFRTGPSRDARGDLAYQRDKDGGRGVAPGDAGGGRQDHLAGTVATLKDAQDGAKYHLLIAGIASLCLIFIIMLIIT